MSPYPLEILVEHIRSVGGQLRLVETRGGGPKNGTGSVFAVQKTVPVPFFSWTQQRE